MMRGEHGEYQRQYHTLGNVARRFSNPDVEAMAKLHAGDAGGRQRGKYPAQHAATLVSANCSRQQVGTCVCVCVNHYKNMLNMILHAVAEKAMLCRIL